ncbi:MAG: cysteine-rich CWC family protein [Anaerolineales bacterium]|nr:cysteine-rich CWC family protein [Chloroflexota bacterium]MBL6980056.1 cysteine-rich CWC family protein [Anaerolineales bacterium]
MTPAKGIRKIKKPNTAICPLCGEPNHCAVAADPNATECWCESLEFPHELLAQIPGDAVRKTCVCQKCLAEFQESHRGSEATS